MLRIVLSRAALFPWLGVILMAVGAAFPEGAVAGMVLLVIGANVAFYSLRDFSQNFAWNRDARPMLNLCGILFLLGLLLAAAATQVDALNVWLALLSTGLYFCLFAVWTMQQPVSWPYRILAFAGLMLMILGAIPAQLGWREWRVVAESEAAPQEMTLADLQKNGFGTNRHIRLKEFRFCDGSAVEKPDKANKMNDLWIPVVPIDGQVVRKEGPSPPVPARITVVAATLLFGEAGPGGLPIGGRPIPDVLRKRREAEGYDCTVVTGIKTLKPAVREQLANLAPLTDFSDVIVLDWRKPSSAETVYGFLAAGGAGLLLGLLAIGLVYRRARKIVGTGSWEPHTEESIADEDGTRVNKPSTDPEDGPAEGRKTSEQ